MQTISGPYNVTHTSVTEDGHISSAVEVDQLVSRLAKEVSYEKAPKPSRPARPQMPPAKSSVATSDETASCPDHAINAAEDDVENEQPECLETEAPAVILEEKESEQEAAGVEVSQDGLAFPKEDDEVSYSSDGEQRASCSVDDTGTPVGSEEAKVHMTEDGVDPEEDEENGEEQQQVLSVASDSSAAANAPTRPARPQQPCRPPAPRQAATSNVSARPKRPAQPAMPVKRPPRPALPYSS